MLVNSVIWTCVVVVHSREDWGLSKNYDHADLVQVKLLEYEEGAPDDKAAASLVNTPSQRSSDHIRSRESREDPEDHVLRTFNEVVAEYKDEFTMNEMQDYWDISMLKQCKEDPDDNVLRTFDQVIVKYSDEFSENEIQEYWDTSMRAESSEAVKNAPRGRIFVHYFTKQETMKTEASAERLMKKASVEDEEEGEDDKEEGEEEEEEEEDEEGDREKKKTSEPKMTHRSLAVLSKNPNAEVTTPAVLNRLTTDTACYVNTAPSVQTAVITDTIKGLAAAAAEDRAIRLEATRLEQAKLVARINDHSRRRRRDHQRDASKVYYENNNLP